MATSYSNSDQILTDGEWVKSGFSTPTGNCVELAKLADGSGIAVRNSRRTKGPALVFTQAEIDAFIQGAAAGHFDSFR